MGGNPSRARIKTQEEKQNLGSAPGITYGSNSRTFGAALLKVRYQRGNIRDPFLI